MRRALEKEAVFIDDKLMEMVSSLANLALSDAEKQAAKKDLEEMLGYVAQIDELDTSQTAPLLQLFSTSNVFREDVVTNGDGSADARANAPVFQNGGFVVPKTTDASEKHRNSSVRAIRKDACGIFSLLRS